MFPQSALGSESEVNRIDKGVTLAKNVFGLISADETAYRIIYHNLLSQDHSLITYFIR